MEEAGGYVRVFGGHGLRHPCVAEISVAGNYPENDHQPGEGPRAAGNSAAAALANAIATATANAAACGTRDDS